VKSAYKQQHGVDDIIVFALTGKDISFEVLMATAARNNFVTRHLYVQTVFLQIPITDIIYVNQLLVVAKVVHVVKHR
jgi:hypothetical protein